MGIRVAEGLTVQATLFEIERGLFHISYRVDGVGVGIQYLPRYQVGTCASEAKQRVEQRAREVGYEAVVWGQADEPASFVPSPVKEVVRSLG